MMYTAYRNGERKVLSFDFATLVVMANIINDDVLKELFNESYGTVETPVGEVSMGELMQSYLDYNEWNALLMETAREFVQALEQEKSWYLSAPYVEAMSYGEWMFYRKCDDNAEEMKQCLERNLKNVDFIDIFRIVNRMEGEW